MPPDPPRGSCLWRSLLPPPTFIFKPSTPKLIENPGSVGSVSVEKKAIYYLSSMHKTNEIF